MLIPKLTYTPTLDPSPNKFLNEEGDFTEPEGGGGEPAGTTGQLQYNNAGAFGAISEGNAGQVLTSAGAGLPPVFAAALAVAGSANSVQVKNGSGLAGVGPGTAGQILTSNGAGVDPSFQALTLPSTITGNKSVTGIWLFQNEVSLGLSLNLKGRAYPSTLASGNTNNFDNGESILPFITNLLFDPDPTLGSALTGMKAPSFRQSLWMFNIGTGATAVLTLKHLNGGSDSANQFICPGETDFVIRAGGGVFVLYDDTGYAKWRVLSP